MVEAKKKRLHNKVEHTVDVVYFIIVLEAVGVFKKARFIFRSELLYKRLFLSVYHHLFLYIIFLNQIFFTTVEDDINN